MQRQRETAATTVCVARRGILRAAAKIQKRKGQTKERPRKQGVTGQHRPCHRGHKIGDAQQQRVTKHRISIRYKKRDCTEQKRPETANRQQLNDRVIRRRNRQRQNGQNAKNGQKLQNIFTQQPVDGGQNGTALTNQRNDPKVIQDAVKSQFVCTWQQRKF